MHISYFSEVVTTIVLKHHAKTCYSAPVNYQLPGLFTEYVRFSRIDGFVSAVFIKQLIVWVNGLTATLIDKQCYNNIDVE